MKLADRNKHMQKTYVIMGYYSREERDYPEYIDEFTSLKDAKECVQDFESVGERFAWIETI